MLPYAALPYIQRFFERFAAFPVGHFKNNIGKRRFYPLINVKFRLFVCYRVQKSFVAFKAIPVNAVFLILKAKHFAVKSSLRHSARRVFLFQPAFYPPYLSPQLCASLPRHKTPRRETAVKNCADNTFYL